MSQLMFGLAFFIMLAGVGVLFAMALRRLPPEPRNTKLRTFSLWWALILALLVIAKYTVL
jgi:hypothetical protein